MTEVQHETWKNVSAGKVWVKVTDRRGDLTDKLVNGGETFKIVSSDRLYNQDLAAEPGLDNFKNGRLIPVRIMETVEDAQEIASNPNLMTESDMAALLTGHYKTFQSRVREISNPVTLGRLLELAEERDEKISKINLLKSRLDEVSPELAVEREVVPPSSGIM